MSEDELDRNLLEKQIQCLKVMSPDDWHFIADDHNWDDALDVLYWIVSQPNCDKATARLVFWKGEPTGHDFEDCEEEMGANSYSVEPMLNYIVRRFNAGGYQREEIEFDIFQVKTGCYDTDNKSYDDTVNNMIDSDIEELKNRAEQQGNSFLSVPEELLVKRTPGRRISEVNDNLMIFDSYPRGVDYDTGEFVF